MSNWFDIARPHEDIRRGDFDEAVFAADLGDVAAGRAVHRRLAGTAGHGILLVGGLQVVRRS
jgi:hypothetical protein